MVRRIPRSMTQGNFFYPKDNIKTTPLKGPRKVIISYDEEVDEEIPTPIVETKIEVGGLKYDVK